MCSLLHGRWILCPIDVVDSYVVKLGRLITCVRIVRLLFDGWDPNLTYIYSKVRLQAATLVYD